MKKIILNLFLLISGYLFGQFPSKLDTISTTTIRPYNKICYLNIYRKHIFKKNHCYQSTGFYITPNIILTAGHNIHTTILNKVTEIVVTPGKYFNITPFDSIVISNYTNCTKAIKTHPKYSFIGMNKINYDFGIIVLNNNVKNDTNQIFFLDSNFELKKGDTLNLAGYPADPHKNYHGYFMTYQRDISRDIKNNTFRHQLNTSTGNSGSPIWVNSKGKRIVVGVHTFSETGTKMNKENIKLIHDWIRNMNN